MKETLKAQPAAAKDDVGWRQFPQFEKTLGSEEPDPLLQKVEKTCRQLDTLIKSGSDADKVRAQSAMTAYGRSLDLLRQLTEMRDKQAAQK
jgi:hypothetical protein